MLRSQVFVDACHAALLWNFEARVFASRWSGLRPSDPGERSYFRPFLRTLFSCIPRLICNLAGPRLPGLLSSFKELFLPVAIEVARWTLDLCSAVGLSLGAPARPAVPAARYA